MDLTTSERATLLKLARETLENVEPSDTILTKTLESPHPCFVTLYGPGERLRGCIGCTETDTALYKNVVRYTYLSATQDPRFDAVSEDEAKRLHINISVLSPLSPIEDWSEIEIGKHGLRVSHRNRHGLLLASVATKFEFTVDRFREETCIKAGLDPTHHQTYEWFSFEEISFSE